MSRLVRPTLLSVTVIFAMVLGLSGSPVASAMAVESGETQPLPAGDLTADSEAADIDSDSSEPTEPAPVDPAIESAIEAASVEAAAIDAPVVVDELTTPTDQTSVLPDGAMSLETSTVPVRTERTEDEWVPIDTDLVLRDGWWEPQDSARPVRFSAGGSDALTQIKTEGGEWLTETWAHGNLPAPVIEGPTATYPDVFDDVDLRLTATELGMASVYIVRTPEAAAQQELADLAVELEGADITREPTGEYTAETETGDTITASSPLWWDSSAGGNAEGPGLMAGAMGVEHTHDETSISLDVAATVEGGSPQYPVFIDPDWNTGRNAAWYTDDAFPKEHYLNVDTLRMGRWAEYNGDAFFEFKIKALAHKQIISARMSTTQVALAAWPNSPVRVRLFGHQDAGFNRYEQKDLWGPQQGSAQSPGNPDAPRVTVGWNVTAGMKTSVGNEWVQFGLSAADPDAPSRRHFSRSATLTVQYNSPPNTPTAPRIDSPQRSCGTQSAPAAVAGSSVVVSVDQKDPDAGNVGTKFFLFNSSLTTRLATRSSDSLAQGRRSVTFSGLRAGTYAWYARGYDGRILGPGQSTSCYFTVDNTAPPAPGVTTTATSFVVGKAVAVSLTSTEDAAGYQYWVDYAAPTASVPPSPVAVSRTAALPKCSQWVGATRFKCANGATAVTVYAAPVDAVSTLYVSAYDKSGNVSPAKALPLFTSTGTPAARDARINSGHAWLTTSMIDPLPVSIPDSNTSLGTAALDLQIPDDGSSWQQVAELKPGYIVPVLHAHDPPDPSMRMRTDAVAVNTSDSFSVSMWIKGSFNEYQATQIIASHWATGSGFELKLQNGKFQFCRSGTYATGETSPVSSCVTAPNQIVKNEWVQVTGVWDRINQQLRLVVGSAASPLAVQPNVKGSNETWAAPGSFMVGPSPTSQRFTGLVANPVIVPGVLDSRQLASLAVFSSPFTQ